jgi:peptidoglycan/LPS O-acetylase OafA/YrhL
MQRRRSVPQSRWRGKLDALTSIRFFFASMVLVGHFTGHFQAELGPLPGFVYAMAPLAVSWFFVLSGFIIAYNYPALSTNKQRRDFLILRVARLWPVHTAILTVALMSGLFYPYPPWLYFQAIVDAQRGHHERIQWASVEHIGRVFLLHRLHFHDGTETVDEVFGRHGAGRDRVDSTDCPRLFHPDF